MFKVTYFHPRYCEDFDVVTTSDIQVSNNVLHFWSGVEEMCLPIGIVRRITLYDGVQNTVSPVEDFD